MEMSSVLLRSIIPTLLIVGFLLGSTAIQHAASAKTGPAQIDANRIVQLADRIRFPQQGFQVDVTITTYSPRRQPDVRAYRILSKGNENTLVMTTAPAIDRGQVLLMKGHNLWVFLPKVTQPVRLPLSQRLTGQVANGDLARANFAGDYKARILRTENIDGREYFTLELIAARRGVTYHRVLYWINRRNSRPLKAEFYTRSNRLLKTCYYQKFEEMEGEIRPTRLVMEDALKEGERSVMDYGTMTIRKLPAKLFTKQYLKKLL